MGAARNSSSAPTEPLLLQADAAQTRLPYGSECERASGMEKQTFPRLYSNLIRRPDMMLDRLVRLLMYTAHPLVTLIIDVVPDVFTRSVYNMVWHATRNLNCVDKFVKIRRYSIPLRSVLIILQQCSLIMKVTKTIIKVGITIISVGCHFSKKIQLYRSKKCSHIRLLG